MGQADAGVVPARRHLEHLGLGEVDLGFGGQDLGLKVLDLFTGHQIPACEDLDVFRAPLQVPELGFPALEHGLGHPQGRLRLAQLLGELLLVEARQELAFLDPFAHGHQQRRHPAGSLRRDGDRRLGRQRAHVAQLGFDVRHSHRLGLDGDRTTAAAAALRRLPLGGTAVERPDAQPDAQVVEHCAGKRQQKEGGGEAFHGPLSPAHASCAAPGLQS